MSAASGSSRRTDVVAALAIGAFVLALFARLLFTNRVLATGDILLYFYPYREYAAGALRAGSIPLWNPYIFLGVPFLANPQAAVLYPLHWPLLGLAAPAQVAWSAALHAWILGYGGYRLARRLGGGGAAGIVTGLVLAGSGFFGGLIGHINQMNGAAWLPWALLLVTPAPGADRWPDRRRALLGRGALLALVVALMLLAGHTQTAYINLFGVGVWASWCALEPAWSARRTGWRAALRRMDAWPLAIYALGAALGILLCAPQLLPTLELSAQGVRSGGLDYRDATSFSLPPATLLWSLLPTYGLVNLEARFGTPAFSEFVGYVGLLGLALALLGAWKARGALRRAGLLLAALGLLLALGRWNPLYFALYSVAPGFDLFRTPARWLMLYTLGAALLAGGGAQWLAARRPGWGRAAAGALAAAVALDLLLASTALPHTHPTAPQAVDALRSAPAHLRTAPAPVAGPDGSAAGGRFLGMSTITYDPGDMADYARLLRDSDPPQLDARAFDDLIVALKVQELLVPNLPLYWRIPAVDGYDGGVLPLLRYNDLVALLAPAGTLISDGRLREQIRSVPPARLLNLLGVRYVVTDKTRDLWFEGVFYDRQIGLALTAATPQGVIDSPTPFAATHLDLIVAASDGAQAQITLQPAAPLTATQAFALTAAAGALRATEGGKTLEGVTAYTDSATSATEQRLRLPLAAPAALDAVTVTLQSSAPLTIQAATLYDARTGMFQALLPSDRGPFALVHSGDVKIYENLAGAPRAWLAAAATPAADAAAALALLRAGVVDPIAAPVVEGRVGLPAAAAAPPGAAAITAYAPERVEIATTSDAPGLLVLNDANYPGWQARVDGTPAPILTTNGLFRGVELPAGAHSVVFTFAPDSWRNGLLVGALGLLLWLGVVVAALWPARRQGAPLL